MHLLVLGGTTFAGRAVVDAALGRGDRVTLFNRGLTGPGLYLCLETMRGGTCRACGAAAGERSWWIRA